MKFLHISDLHLGKRLNEFSMIEDQKYILERILEIAKSEKADAVLIAGDIYDKYVPSTEAVELFDDFIVRLAACKFPTFIISGNHDSQERLAFGGRLIDLSGIHLSPVYSGEVKPYTLTDEHGEVNIYMLPFVKPANVRRFFPDAEIASYTDAAAVAIKAMGVDPQKRNVLIAHQFVTGAARSDSEDVSVGGLDNVDADVFRDFDYVALGHIHKPQSVTFTADSEGLKAPAIDEESSALEFSEKKGKASKIRYSGTPLKYSFSEANHEKSVTIAELAEKGNLAVRTIPLFPLHELVELKGSYAELTLKSFYEDTSYRTDYTHITLTDEEDIPDAIGKLRVIYRNLMRLDYDNARTRKAEEVDVPGDVEELSPLELFARFYELQNGAPMSGEQAEYMEKLIEDVWEDER